MKKLAAFLAVLLLCVCDRRSMDVSRCMGNPDSLDSCPPAEVCPGRCLPALPVGWSMPVLLWSGPELMAPECPADWAGTVGYEGHADLLAPSACGMCACDPPTGECGLPANLIASTKRCGFDGGLTISFAGLDPDPDICNTENGVGVDFAPRSVSIDPLTMMESTCKPITPPTPRSGSVAWGTFARACMGTASAPCVDPGSYCAPTAEPPQGFSQCIYRGGVHDCPLIYPKKHVFYDDVSDARGCPACSCGPPTGSVCSAYLSVYQDASCSDFVFAVLDSSLTPTCADVAPGFAVMGKKVEDITYEPGSCEPIGSEPIGSADLLGPTTFCCQE